MASQIVNGTVNRNLNFSQNESAISAYQITVNVSRNYTYTNSNAGGSGVVDQLYAKQLTLSAAATTINLTSLTDVGGNTIDFARVREFVVENLNTTIGQDCKVEAGAANGWSVLPPSTNPLYARSGGVLTTATVVGTVQISDPFSTGASNGNVVTTGSCNVTLDPGSNTITVNVIILGTSVA